jgi:uncharacterized tellurite resistance protein B-like protein
MLARLQELFRDVRAPAEGGADAAHTRNLAAAALLIEVARADFAFDEDEQRTIEATLRETLDLGDDEVREIVRQATEESREATSLHQFTRLVHETHSLDEKKALMEQLWRVAYADGRLDRYEEQLLRRVADLIHLRHAEFMQAKHAAAPDT